MYRLLTLFLVLISTYVDADGEQAELQQIVNEIVNTEAMLLDSNNARARQIQALRESESAINEIRRTIRHHESERTELQRALGVTEQSLQEATRQVQLYEREIAHIFESLWINRDKNGLAALLAANEGAQQRQSYYYQVMNSAQQAAIEVHRNKAARVSQLKRLQLNEIAAINDVTREINRELHTLESEYDHRQGLVTQLDRDISSADARLTRLRSDQQQLQRVIAELERAIQSLEPANSRQPFIQLKGQLTPPVDGALVNQFNQTRRGSVKWTGHRYVAERGKEVTSVAYGRVIFADWLSGQGLLIAIDHGDNYWTLYANNQSIFKSVGEWVEPGEVIAEVGNSGGSSDSALYFEIRHNGVPQNPRQWLK